MSFLHPSGWCIMTQQRVDSDNIGLYICFIMKHISILVPKGMAIVDTILGSYNLFEMANNRYRKSAGEKLFALDLVAEELDPIQYNSFISITPTKTTSEVSQSDLIIVPGVVGNMEKQIAMNQTLIRWMREQRIQHNAEIASLCRGAFLLADTGLMHGKACATHWLTHDKFRDLFPEVNLLPEKIISEDNGIYSSGGAYSFLSLLLYLIEKHYGREVAIWCSKVAEIDFDRLDQNQFTIFSGQKDHSDEAIVAIQNYMEANYSEKLQLEELANQVATSSRNFIRRFKKATNNTPIEYLQRIRIEASKKQLESSTQSINEVMYASGYNDSKTFRTLFKRYAGMTPLEYRNKFNREMAYS